MIISPWLSILLVLATLSGVMACLKALSARCRLHPETSRKSVHIVMGVVTLSFPWIFRESWPVLFLAAVAVAALAGTRLLGPLRERFGGVLHGVERRSLGEIYFPLAVASLFLLSGGNRLLYVVPLLTLTLADAVAALVGVRYGQHRFATSEGSKSAEGSLAFFVVAFLSAHVPLLLMSDTGRAESLLIALMLGLLVMLFEAISVGGFDNLFIPLGCYGLLRRYLALDAEDLLPRVAGICLIAVLVFAWRRRTTLKDSALLAAALVGYMNWALGGWQWFGVSLLLFLTYTRLWPSSEKGCEPVHTVGAVGSVAAPGMVWLFTGLQTDLASVLAPFILCYAANLVMVGMIRLEHARPDRARRKNLVRAVFTTWLVFLPTCFLPAIGSPAAYAHSSAPVIFAGVSMAVIALPLLSAVALLHQRLVSQDLNGLSRSMRRGGIALTASFAGWAGLMLFFSSPWVRGG